MNDIQRQVWAEQNAMANEGRVSEYDPAELALEKEAFEAVMEADAERDRLADEAADLAGANHRSCWTSRGAWR